MPQAAIAAIGNFIVTWAAALQSTNVWIRVFAYAATQYLLNRAATAMAHKSRGVGLGPNMASHYFDNEVQLCK